jgi:hypothetical protein|tara:strand:- start:425 stop:1888 length:1464 start_codon:yes stop_codon:yes gene_type:complete
MNKLKKYVRPVYNYTIITFGELQDIKDVTYFDESFMSRSRWKELQEQMWMHSLLLGYVITPIILVDIEKCMTNCSDKDSDDYLYFKKLWDAGWRYITNDGWNRNGTANKWKNDKVFVEKGVYQFDDGYELVIHNVSKKSDLSEPQNKKIDSIGVPLVSITKASRNDLSQVFLAVNTMVAQNAMELRNAMNTDIAKPIRDLASKLEYWFTIKGDGKSKSSMGIFKSSEADRRYIDEFILDFIIFCHMTFGKNWNSTTRDFYYSKQKSDLLTSFKYAEPILKKIIRTGCSKDKKSEEYKREFNIVSPRSAFLTLACYVLFDKQNISITQEKLPKFVNVVQQLFIKFCEDSNCTLRTYEEDGVTPKKVFTFKSASRREPIQLKFSTDLIMHKIITEHEDLLTHRDPQRLFSKKQRIDIWERQGGKIGICHAKCPYTGKEIRFEDMFNSEMWQVDHILPYSHGGQTNIENGQLIDARANKVKSNHIQDAAD